MWYNLFYKRKTSECVGKEKVKFLKTNEKYVKMGWMNGIPWVDCHTLEARTIVGE